MSAGKGLKVCNCQQTLRGGYRNIRILMYKWGGEWGNAEGPPPPGRVSKWETVNKNGGATIGTHVFYCINSVGRGGTRRCHLHRQGAQSVQRSTKMAGRL